jgi:F0F1-type ATP synthase delta subunit
MDVKLTDNEFEYLIALLDKVYDYDGLLGIDVDYKLLATIIINLQKSGKK